VVTARKLGAARGLERTLKAAGSRLDDRHAALVSMARALAAAVDAEPGNAALWRELRATVVALGQVAGEVVDDDTAQFLAIVRTPTLREAVVSQVATGSPSAVNGQPLTGQEDQ